MRLMLQLLFFCCVFSTEAAPLPSIDLGEVKERQVMIPMRDGVHLSA